MYQTVLVLYEKQNNTLLKVDYTIYISIVMQSETS